MRSSHPAFLRSMTVLTLALVAVPVFAGLSSGTAEFLSKKKALKLFYTKAQAESAFLTPAEGDAAFLSAEEAGARFLTPADADNRYQTRGCPGGPYRMVRVGSVCIDRYEASVWSSPTGGTQYGVDSDDYPCHDNGQDCKGKIFVRSVPGVPPSGFITWFQAQQALANSGKRLPTNAEWQMAVAGTPDGTACNESTEDVDVTGENPECVSAWGAYDMVGNVAEWVADWVPQSNTCGEWPPGWTLVPDLQCLAGAREELEVSTGVPFSPAALIRGGSHSIGAAPGPFSIEGRLPPFITGSDLGFRGAR